MIDPETFERLKAIPEREWGKIYKELTAYAEYKLFYVGFKPRSEKDSVTGEDFATQAIEKLFDGARAWDFNRFPDILIHLKGIVKSLISSHLKTSLRSSVRKEKMIDPVGDSETLKSAIGLLDEGTPDQILLSTENWKQIETEFGDDEIGFLIFCEWVDEIPPRKIADNYDIDVKDVYNALKRGRRILKKIFAEN
jgi:hypothetical protein